MPSPQQWLSNSSSHDKHDKHQTTLSKLQWRKEAYLWRGTGFALLRLTLRGYRMLWIMCLRGWDWCGRDVGRKHVSQTEESPPVCMSYFFMLNSVTASGNTGVKVTGQGHLCYILKKQCIDSLTLSSFIQLDLISVNVFIEVLDLGFLSQRCNLTENAIWFEQPFSLDCNHTAYFVMTLYKDIYEWALTLKGCTVMGIHNGRWTKGNNQYDKPDLRGFPVNLLPLDNKRDLDEQHYCYRICLMNWLFFWIQHSRWIHHLIRKILVWIYHFD